MPIITVALTAPPDAALSARIAGEMTALTQEHLRKDPAVTAVAIHYVDPAHWFAGGRSLADQGTHTFWLDIKVVDGTNTKPELAAYMDAVYAAMGRLAGGVHHESYVLIHEVPAAAYGFGGLTQEHRFIAGRLAVPAR
ncbi:tautomerase family protein [Azospirillum halopraeferens]|uniref:tautomerase family protein n=1 Tax=Azospirillum halopraeferens TaxID=34010 RepID=UPI0003FDEFCF|nr:4-oxalocrotonate tautomerase family protein [Azospirillum halopraeferens]